MEKEILYSSRELKINLKKNLLYLYKIQFKFRRTYSFIKYFYKNSYFGKVDNYFQVFFNNLNYELSTKESILKYLKQHKTLTEEKYEIIYELSCDFKKYEEINSKSIEKVINIIKSYNSGYTYFYSDNTDDEIKLSKKNIDEKLNKIRF